MPTTDQKSDLLFKKYLGKGSSGTSSLYFNEPIDGRVAVFPSQIWQDQSLIPLTAGVVGGITEQVIDLTLTQVPGQPFAFFAAELKDAIPFNYDFNGSYVPTLKTNTGTTIPFGQNDWIIDIETGMVTFYAGLPTGVSDTLPPKITFWRYIGGKGLPTASSTASWSITSSWSETASYAFTSSRTQFSEQSSMSFHSITSLNSEHANAADISISSSYATFAVSANTASWAIQSKTASYLNMAGGTASHAVRAEIADLAVSASYAQFAQVTLGTASYAFDAVNAETASLAITASHAIKADTASFVAQAKTAISASYSTYAEIALGTSSYAIFAENAATASYLDMAGGTASFALTSNNTRYTASFALKAQLAITASAANWSETSSYSDTASYAHFAQVALGTSSYAINAGTASLADLSTLATLAENARTASYIWIAKNAITASYIELAESASYAQFAQVVLGTSSYAIMSDWAVSASQAISAAFAHSASHAERAEYTYGTSSYANKATFAYTASYLEQDATASFALVAQMSLGTSSYAIFADSASYVNLAKSASVAIHATSASYIHTAQTASYAIHAENTDLADAAINALSASVATFAFISNEASSSISASYAETTSLALRSETTTLAETASYALTASYFDGTASGSIINVGVPTDGYYGSGSEGNIAGISSGDKLEDALDKLDVILDKLVPTKPPALSTKSIALSSSYSARRAGTNVTYTYVTDDTTPSFTMVGGMTSSNAFSDGNNGTLSALIDGTSIGSKALTDGSDVGTYDGLQIVSDADYYLGVSGKAGFWYGLLATVNVQSPIDDDVLHTASLSHTLTGTCSPAYFYIDNPETPSQLFTTITPTGSVYISGVPALVGGTSGSSVAISATGSMGLTWRFYNSTRVFSIAGSGITTTNCPLPSSPAAGSVLSGSWSVSVIAGSANENPTFTLTAYNSKGTTNTLSVSNTHYRMDSTLDTSNRVTSGIGQYPSSGYGSTFVSSESLATVGNEELQMLNGQYQYPTGNYTTALPVAGPDYTSVPIGTFGNFRWTTLSLGSVTNASNLSLTFTNSSNFSGGGTAMTNFSLLVRVAGSSPTSGWIDGNSAYSGVGSPSSNGDAALVVASSTSTVKLVTFGTNTKTGNVYARVGIPNGDNKKFGNVTMTYT